MSTPRRIDEVRAERVTIPFDHAEITANGAPKFYSVPEGRLLRVVRASYVNPTGLAGDGTNAFRAEVKNGTAIVATLFNTDTNDNPAGASLAAATFVEGVLTDTDADLVLDAGDVLSLAFTEDGTATLPAGRLVVEGYLL